MKFTDATLAEELKILKFGRFGQFEFKFVERVVQIIGHTKQYACRACGLPVWATRRKYYCSEECSDRWAQMRSQHYWNHYRSKAIQRDRACLECGSKNALEVDHITPVKESSLREFDLDNLRTLCGPCHEKLGAKPNSREFIRRKVNRKLEVA